MSGDSLFDPNVVRRILGNVDKNCLSYWFPLLQKSGVRIPKTRIVKTDVELGHLLDSRKPEGYVAFLGELRAAAEKVSHGGPFFLRTGQLSAKHSWKETCYVYPLIELSRHVNNLIEESAMCDVLGRPFNVWVVREYIPMVSAFTAFLGMPINKERRYFIKDGEVLCHHGYWPAQAFEGRHQPEDPKWREKLAWLNEETEEEVALLTGLSKRVSREFDGEWSLDWSRAQQGGFVAIDMAVAEESFHWPDCPRTER
jgi:hypothetical protein